MSGRFVRSSKYRHVFGRSTKKELCYDNLHISDNAWDSNIIKANPKYLSVNWKASGGGAFAVIPLEERGKLPELMPLFRGHTGPVLDTDWSPFNDSLVASGSDDGKVFLWQVPENFSVHYDEEVGPQDISPVLQLAGHQRKVGHVLFHPTAENVIASSSGDYTVKVWDINGQTPKLTLKHADMAQSMSWNTDGSLLVTTCRDKKLRVWDPRQEAPAHEVAGHSGAKNSRAVWLTGDVGGEKFATTGFSKMSDRQVGLWDLKTLTQGPVGDFEFLDSISGVCMPFWDESAKCLYLAGKGDGNIRYYEYSPDGFIFLSEYKSSDPQRGLAFMPKRGLSVQENEVMRAFKTVNDTYIEPISFIVPRRAETFQADIYPPAPSGKNPLSADAWFAGENRMPELFNMEDLYTGEQTGPVATPAPKPVIPTSVPSTPTAAPTSTKTTSAPAPQPASPVTSAPPAQITPAAAPKPTPATEPKPAARSPSPVKSTVETPIYQAPKRAPIATATTTLQASPLPAPAESPAVMSQLSKITALLESQNKTLESQNEQIKTQSEQIKTQSEQIKTQSEQIKEQSEQIKSQSEEIKAQNEQIGELRKEVDVLKEKIAATMDDTVLVKGADVEGLEEEGRRKDERIRKLELELEEARS